jgi:hypothetical protein
MIGHRNFEDDYSDVKIANNWKPSDPKKILMIF